ncbi:MAG: hypothetical protein IJY03_08925 [Prevotella sp.]|nr:hypothetical protein [Prevotella sp.]
MSRQYNFIYKQLVDGEGDITGHVAYSLYKMDKICFIEKFKKEHDGKEPSEEEFRPFHDIACMDASIERYKMHSMSVLQTFLSDTLSSTTEQIENDCRKRHKEMLSDIVSEMKPKGFLNGVLQSVVGAFIFMLLLCALMFVLHLSDTKYTVTIGGNGNAKIETNK